jgi:hypothetical protein
MTNKKHNTLVIIGAVIVSVLIWAISLNINKHQSISYRTFEAANGWGYDILVNEQIVIHQDRIPAIGNRKGFTNAAQAAAAASMVIQKIQHGKLPSLTSTELKTIYVVKD